MGGESGLRVPCSPLGNPTHDLSGGEERGRDQSPLFSRGSAGRFPDGSTQWLGEQEAGVVMVGHVDREMEAQAEAPPAETSPLRKSRPAENTPLLPLRTGSASTHVCSNVEVGARETAQELIQSPHLPPTRSDAQSQG